VARDLLGAILVSRLGGRFTAGRIVETEAYLGPEDGASHAAFRPASRWLFFGPGGIAYVFWAYGLHYCLNAIAGSRGTPGCVLIRAVEPLAGLATMARRRGRSGLLGSARASAALASGPARLTQALGVTVRDTGRDLRRGQLTIHRAISPTSHGVATGPRIGITRSPDLPLRFWLRGHPSVSR
jgi:DNA-3-methyladenine glycosylase